MTSLLYYCLDAVPEVLRAGIYHNAPGGIIDHSEPQQGYLSANFILAGGADLKLEGPAIGSVQDVHVTGRAYLWREGDTIYGQCGPEGMVSVFVRFAWPGWQPRKTGRAGEIEIPQRVSISLAAQAGLRHAYYQLIECYQTKPPGWAHVAASYLRLILTIMHAESRGRGGDGSQPANPAIDRRLRLAVEFMEQNMRRSLSIGEIAEYAALSEDYFRRLFVRQLGLKPVAYLEQLRVKEAKRILAEDATVSAGEAGQRAGFSDPRYFCRVFKKHFGLTPSEYRKGLSQTMATR